MASCDAKVCSLVRSRCRALAQPGALSHRLSVRFLLGPSAEGGFAGTPREWLAYGFKC